jgi:hypothetical protein
MFYASEVEEYVEKVWYWIGFAGKAIMKMSI